MVRSLWIRLTMHMLSMVHWRLSIIRVPKKTPGIFSQSQGWLILAEALRGHGERAFLFYGKFSCCAESTVPKSVVLNHTAMVSLQREKQANTLDALHVHWLTGTASTVMVGCVEGILGLRPDLEGLRLSPSVPKSWKHFEIESFPWKTASYLCRKSNEKESGCCSLVLNGQKLADNYIPEKLLQDKNEVILTL